MRRPLSLCTPILTESTQKSQVSLRAGWLQILANVVPLEEERMSQNLSKAEIDAIYAAHEREQVIWIAKNTTPDQRVRWLEQAIKFARYVAEDRAKQGLRTVFPGKED